VVSAVSNLEATAIASGLGELVEPTLGIFDLLAWGKVDRRIVRHIDHLLADANELAPDREVIDRATVINGVYDGGGLGRQPSQILPELQSGDVEISGQESLQRHRRGEIDHANEATADIVGLLMNRLEEMLWLEKVGDAIERLVIDEDRAQKRLLGLDVVGRRAIERGGGFHKLACGRFDCHDVLVL